MSRRVLRGLLAGISLVGLSACADVPAEDAVPLTVSEPPVPESPVPEHLETSAAPVSEPTLSSPDGVFRYEDSAVLLLTAGDIQNAGVDGTTVASEPRSGEVNEDQLAHYRALAQQGWPSDWTGPNPRSKHGNNLWRTEDDPESCIHLHFMHDFIHTGDIEPSSADAAQAYSWTEAEAESDSASFVQRLRVFASENEAEQFISDTSRRIEACETRMMSSSTLPDRYLYLTGTMSGEDVHVDDEVNSLAFYTAIPRDDNNASVGATWKNHQVLQYSNVVTEIMSGGMNLDPDVVRLAAEKLGEPAE